MEDNYTYTSNWRIGMSDNAHKYALPRLSEGVRKAVDIVAPTLGAAGTNVVLEATLPPYAITTNDGATIIKAIELADPVERIGLGFLKEAVERSNANSGDGSTTTSVLLNSILQEGIKSGVSTLEIKQSLDQCLSLIETSLDEQTRQISVDDIPSVAKIAGESESLAQVLGDIYKKIGKDGIVHLEGSGTYETNFNIIEGVRFGGTGYLSPYMATEGKKALYHNPSILVTKRKIEKVGELEPLLNVLVAKGKTDGQQTLVIFTDDMSSDVARLLIELQKNPQRSINVLVIKAPVFWKNYVFEDFAAVTGSTILEDASGITFKTLQLDHLGTVDTLICDKDEVTLIGTKDATDHLNAIRSDETLPSEDKAVRLAYLCTKTAILRLGAKSETELSYLKLKAEDAIHSSRLALQSGIVAGGGVALLNACTVLPDTIGGKILKTALESPARQIRANSGILESVKYEYDGKGHFGLDARSGQTVNMFEAGIIDSAAIVKGAIRNALGVASTLLTTSSVVLLPTEPVKHLQNNAFPLQ